MHPNVEILKSEPMMDLIEAAVKRWFIDVPDPVSYASSENRLLWLVEAAYFAELKAYEERRRQVDVSRQPMPLPEYGKFWLYRLYNPVDRLLYIGITANFPARMVQHRRTFGALLDHWTLEVYTNREEVLEAERVAIGNEAPAFNNTH